MTNNLIIFIKNPILGCVKTRLAETVGDDLALKVYYDLMERCRIVSLSLKVNRFLFYSKNIADDDWPKKHFNKKVQSEGDLGEKIKNAFLLVHKRNNKTLIIGSDCYDLTKKTIDLAFEKLALYDLIIGPANDGGYYLLGTKEFIPSLFDDINWSSEHVLSQTIVRAKNLNLSYCLLEELVDIDTFEDLSISSYLSVFKNYD